MPSRRSSTCRSARSWASGASSRSRPSGRPGRRAAQMVWLSLTFDHRLVDGGPARVSCSAWCSWSRSRICCSRSAYCVFRIAYSVWRLKDNPIWARPANPGNGIRNTQSSSPTQHGQKGAPTMTHAPGFLALDLGAKRPRHAGAAGGRAADLPRCIVSPTGRFACRTVLHWDTLRLWTDIKDGIAPSGGATGRWRASAWTPGAWTSACWTGNGVLLGNPYHYRDGRTDGMLDEAFAGCRRRRSSPRPASSSCSSTRSTSCCAMALSGVARAGDGARPS